MTKKLQDALKKQKKTTQRQVPQIVGTLGIPIGGERRVEVPGRNSFVFVKLRDNQSEVIQAFNNKVAPSYGLPVIVEWHGGRYVVIDVDTVRYQNNWTGYSPYLPRHGNTHSFDTDTGGGGDVVWVHSRQFMPALIIPSGSSGGPNVLLSPFPMKTADGWMYVGNTGTADLTAYKPNITGAHARMVLVYLDTVSGNPYLLMNSGTYFDATITGSAAIMPYVPAISNPEHIPLAAIRLVTGTTIIGWDNIYDVRQFIRPVPTGTSPDIPSDNIYFLTDTSAGVSSYDLMTQSRPTGTVSYYIESVSATGTMLGDWITEPSVPNASFITDGAYHVHLLAQKISGTQDAKIRYILSKRAASGVETKLFTSDYSEVIPEVETDIDIITLGAEYSVETTDRLVLRIYAVQDGVGTAPTISMAVQGTSYARLEIPAIASAAGSSTLTIQDEGVDQGTATTLNFVGTNVVATVSGGVARIFVTGSSGGVSNLTGTSIGTPNRVVLTDSNGFLYTDPQVGWGYNSGKMFIEFGMNVAGKEANAGRMGYQIFDNDFDIVGAGTAGGDRWVRIYDNIRASIFQGQYQNLTLTNTYTYLNATGSIVGVYPNAPEKSSNITGSDHILGLDSLNSYASVRMPLVNLAGAIVYTDVIGTFLGEGAGTIPASTTHYSCPYKSYADTTQHQFPWPEGGTISNLSFRLGTAQPASGSIVITLQINNVDTALVVTVPAGSAAATFENTTDRVSIVATDRIKWKFVNNATATSGTLTAISMILSKRATA